MEDPRSRIRQIVAEMLAEHVDLIEGCRLVARLASSDPELRTDPALVGMIGVASETDDLPLGEQRRHWSREALAKLDDERVAYLEKVRESLLTDCTDVLARFSAVGSRD